MKVMLIQTVNARTKVLQPTAKPPLHLLHNTLRSTATLYLAGNPIESALHLGEKNEGIRELRMAKPFTGRKLARLDPSIA